jgi:hypothetical protein
LSSFVIGLLVLEVAKGGCGIRRFSPLVLKLDLNRQLALPRTRICQVGNRSEFGIAYNGFGSVPGGPWIKAFEIAGNYEQSQGGVQGKNAGARLRPKNRMGLIQMRLIKNGDGGT